jgi:hypothetical protein
VQILAFTLTNRATSFNSHLKASCVNHSSAQEAFEFDLNSRINKET